MTSDALARQRELYNDAGTVIRGYVVYPDVDRGYSVVEVRDHRYLPDDPTRPIYTEAEAAALHDLDRLVVDRVAMSPAVALDVAIDLWDESQRPVCLYLNGYGKVVFDDFWESVITYGDAGASEVFSYLGYSQEDVDEVIQIQVDSAERLSSAVRGAISLDRCLPCPEVDKPIYLHVPKAAVEVWREHSWGDPSAQGINYIAGHPIVKAAIRAFFDMADIPGVKLAFDANSTGEFPVFGWYRQTEEVVYINYGVFAPYYVLGTLGIGRYQGVNAIDAFAGTVIHEMAHHAELRTGFRYVGDWDVEKTRDGSFGVPKGSETFAVAAEHVGVYALREHDPDFSRYHLGGALNITQAINEVRGSSALRELQAVMDRVVFQHDGIISHMRGNYAPSRYGSILTYQFWIKIPEEFYADFQRDVDATMLDMSIYSRTVTTQQLKKAPWERQWANLNGIISVSASDQAWIEQAYLKYPNRNGVPNAIP